MQYFERWMRLQFNYGNSTKRKKPSKTKALIQLTYIAKKNLVDTELPSVTLNGLPFT